MKIEKNYLTCNKYSRPGIAIKKVRGIVVHYVGNPGSTAIGNRNYFESLKGQGINGKRYASSHSETEIAYHASAANRDHIGIEVCHPLADGKFNAINKEGTCYVKLRDLADDKIKVDYNQKEKLPIIRT